MRVSGQHHAPAVKNRYPLYKANMADISYIRFGGEIAFVSLEQDKHEMFSSQTEHRLFAGDIAPLENVLSAR